MRVVNSKKLIAVIFTICALLTSANVAFAENKNQDRIVPEMKLVIPETSANFDTHVENTPQWDDELKVEITYDKEKVTEEPVVTWFRFHNKPKYDDSGKKVADTYYEEIGEGLTYRVTAEDIHHVLKVETAVDGTFLCLETEPVEKRNYGKVKLSVVNNTNYGDTDGYVGLLDTRMEYTCDDVTICEVKKDGAILNSGTTEQTLNPDGFTWKVRYKGTTMVERSEWETFTIQAGKKTPLESFELNLISRTLTPDEPEYQLKTTFTPENAYIGSVTYKSSDPSVATVSEDGKITAISNGEATITVTVNGVDSEIVQECLITAKKFNEINEAFIVEDSITLELKDNEQRKLTSAIYPETATDYTESWRSSDENICQVTNTGIVSCVNAGNAMVIYTVSQGDKQVMDTVNVEVLPIPSVTAPDDWKQGSGEDLWFEFVGCTPDENTIVTIQVDDGRHELVTDTYYTIDNNRLIIKYDYLMKFSEGNAAFSFEFPEVETENEEEVSVADSSNTEIAQDNINEESANEVPVPVITSASSDSFGKTKKVSLLNAAISAGQKLFSKVSDEDSENQPKAPTYLTKSVLFKSDKVDEVSLKPGDTFNSLSFTYSRVLGDDETIDLVPGNGFEEYFYVDNVVFLYEKQNDVEKVKGVSFIIATAGVNTPVQDFNDPNVAKLDIVIKKEGGSDLTAHTYKAITTGLLDYNNISLTITENAEITPTSKSKCTIEPTITGATLDDDFLKAYEITFKEVDGPDSTDYTKAVNHFKSESLYLNENKKCEAIANWQSQDDNPKNTGYIRAFLKLKMVEEKTGAVKSSLELGESKNTCTVKIELYKITKCNYHQWSQRSKIDIKIYIQGDFYKFLEDNGGSFSKTNVFLKHWNDKTKRYDPITKDDKNWTIEKISDDMAVVTIKYRLLWNGYYVGNHQFWISFKYDGSTAQSVPGKAGNYVRYDLTVLPYNVPATGDSFNMTLWTSISLTMFAVAGCCSYLLIKKKKQFNIESRK